MTGSVLAPILWWWRRTGPAALLKVTRRTGLRELGIAGSAILDEESWMSGQQTYPHTIHFNM